MLTRKETIMLNIESSALVIIDIQDKLVQASKYGEEAAFNAAKLAKTANLLSIPTIITEQYPKGLGGTVSQIKDVIDTETYTVEKTSFSAMAEEAFASKIKQLKDSNINQIFICGIETHICVLQTAHDLINEGFEVFVIKDACASRNKKEYKTGLELLKQYGAKISCVEIALFELLKTSKNPEFKEIQALIK